jgi:hypothetical protein
VYYTGKFLPLLTDSRLSASRRSVHRQLRGTYEFVHESICLLTDNVRNKVVNNSQITAGVENAVPLHVGIPSTGGRGSDLSFEAVLREYLQFSYECFLLVLRLGGYCCNLCPSNNPRRKNRKV